MWDI